ncbi:MAG: DUF4038 domain-containing protein, partial [Verrucomicrobiota bacterium]
MRLRVFGILGQAFAILFLLMCVALGASGAERVLQTEANVMVELTLTASRAYADPFNEVTLDAVFIDPKGQELRVPAFWAGTNLWKLRYASPIIGKHSFRSDCSQANDKGLHDVTGKVEIKKYTGKNPLYQHGPLKVSANQRFLEHTDGKPFFWLGDTWWMGLCHRIKWPEDFQKLAADRKEKGFNVIQIVAGLYPDMPPFDPRGANEAGFPWTTNYSSIRPEYFNAADQRLQYLVEQGFTPCIVGEWGYFMKWMGVEKAKQHWRNLIARYGALPVVWCLAGEANMPWYHEPGFFYSDRKQITSWTEVNRYLRATDPYHRLITIHPGGGGRLSSHAMTDAISLIDFDMLQTPHGLRDAVPVTVNTVRESYADKPVMPVINGEPAYEMLDIGGKLIATEWTRRMYWVCMMNGAAGHTYGANGIWQANRKGQPHGPSPLHAAGSVGWGIIPWDEAMNLPGSKQVALGAKLFQQYPWQDFQPHPEWATFAGKSTLNLEGSQWIWFPEGKPAQDAPAGKRFFRRIFVLPEGKKILSAQLRVSADDQFSAQVNGAVIGASNAGTETWKTGKQFNDVARLLKTGTNVLAITAENLPANGANPAGLIEHLEIHFADGEILKLISDGDWRSAKSEISGWNKKDFDDSAWDKALVIGKYGDGPWGPIDPLDNNSDVYGPQSTGIPGVVRLIYVPENDPIIVHHLGRNAAYSASFFDPVTGDKIAPTKAKADKNGQLTFSPPAFRLAGQPHDWVLILEPADKKNVENKNASNELTLSNDQIAWQFDWSDGHLRSSFFDNKISGHRFALSGEQELALVFSAEADRMEQPLARASDFKVRGMRRVDAQHVVFDLRSSVLKIEVALHVQLDGATRRKWAEVKNQTGKELLLLDVELDDLTTDGIASGGGEGQPV